MATIFPVLSNKQKRVDDVPWSTAPTNRPTGFESAMFTGTACSCKFTAAAAEALGPLRRRGHAAAGKHPVEVRELPARSPSSLALQEPAHGGGGGGGGWRRGGAADGRLRSFATGWYSGHDDS
jgi:hypothetical protein